MSKPKYIQLNLKTKEHDLREYLDKKSVEASVEAGERISVTRYIQELILEDMKKDDVRQANKAELRTEIKEQVDKMDMQELEILSYIIQKMQK